MNKTSQYSLIFTVSLLSACAPPKPAIELPVNKLMPVVKRQAETAKISSWELKGAIAAKNSSKGWSATMDWIQHGVNSYQIRLMGPLGGGTVLITKQGNLIVFEDGGKKVSSTNGNELLLKQTGVQLPVNNLYYWVRGLPAPETIEKEKYDQYNHLTHLKQGGYSIEFARYTAINNIDLPSIIRLTGKGLSAKVIIKSWNIK